MPTSLIAAGLPALIGAAGSYFGGQAAAGGADRAAQLQAQIRAQNQQIEDPYIQGGQRNFDLYNNATGANGTSAQSDFYNNFKTDPAYSGVLAAGTNAIANSAAARGTMYGGNTARDINDYGGNLLNKAYNDRIGQLYQGAGLGAGASNALVGSNTQSGAYQGSLMNQAGLYQGQADIGIANSLVGGVNSYNKMGAYGSGSGGASSSGGYGLSGAFGAGGAGLGSGSGNNANNWLNPSSWFN